MSAPHSAQYGRECVYMDYCLSAQGNVTASISNIAEYFRGAHPSCLQMIERTESSIMLDAFISFLVGVCHVRQHLLLLSARSSTVSFCEFRPVPDAYMCCLHIRMPPAQRPRTKRSCTPSGLRSSSVSTHSTLMSALLRCACSTRCWAPEEKRHFDLSSYMCLHTGYRN